MEPPVETRKRNAPIWVKVFVALHIVAITSWSLPTAPDRYHGQKVTVLRGGKQVVVHVPPRTPLRIRTESAPAFIRSVAEFLQLGFLVANDDYLKDSPLKFYLLSSGFWQYWDMFAPNPANVDIYCHAVIHYRNGSTKVYQYPRISSLPLGAKFLKERWRKFFERAGSAEYRYMWPIFAQHIAEMNDDKPGNPPVEVELHRHEMTIAPPGQPVNETYTDSLYFEYRVDQKALREAEVSGH